MTPIHPPQSSAQKGVLQVLCLYTYKDARPVSQECSTKYEERDRLSLPGIEIMLVFWFYNGCGWVLIYTHLCSTCVNVCGLTHTSLSLVKMLRQ